MRKILILFAICLCAISCEQNEFVDLKVKIKKEIPDGVYIESDWRGLEYKNGDLYDWFGAPGVTATPTDHYILIENNIPYHYYDITCSFCDARLVELSNINVIFDIKNKLWKEQNSFEYNIIKYTENNITLFETEQYARARSSSEDDWWREYIVFERVDDNGELFQKLKAAKSYTLEEYREWWKENGCERCGHYMD